jgi:hypothetical protein
LVGELGDGDVTIEEESVSVAASILLFYFLLISVQFQVAAPNACRSDDNQFANIKRSKREDRESGK